MCKEPHLTVKNEECNKLWHKWYEKFRDGPKVKRLSTEKNGVKTDELNAMIHQTYLDMPHKPQMWKTMDFNLISKITHNC